MDPPWRALYFPAWFRQTPDYELAPALIMSDPGAATPATADLVLRTLRRTRQVRQFTNEPVTEADLLALLNVARWSGSSMNGQPWTFILIRDRADLERLAEFAPSQER